MGYLEVVIQASPHQGGVKAQATYGSVKFGAANLAARQEAHFPLNNQLEEDSSDVKTLEG